jgi:hypothetical protein
MYFIFYTFGRTKGVGEGPHPPHPPHPKDPQPPAQHRNGLRRQRASPPAQR